MPTTTHQIENGARVLIFTCDCGSPGCFGTGVSLREALRTKDQSKAGRWFCSYRDGKPYCAKGAAR